MMRAARRSAVAALGTGLRVAASPRLMRHAGGARFWRFAVSAPGIPDGLRAKLANRISTNMIKAGRSSDAMAASSAAARRIRSPRLKADLLVASAGADLRNGQLPRQLAAWWTAELACADTLHRKGEMHKAASCLATAMPIGLHRAIHFDRLSSPLVENPIEFLAPLHRSSAVQALNTRTRATPAAPRQAGRPLRLLVATTKNDNFLGEIRQRYEEVPQVDARFLDLAADPLREPLTRRTCTNNILEHILTGDSEYGRQVEQWLRPHFDWADTVFIDWCVSTAALFTMLDPGTTRIIVRLHSYEVFTLWPHLVGFNRVDDLVFVSEHMRDLVVAALPQLSGEDAPRLSVIANAMDLRSYPRAKPDQARFNLGLVGINAVAKDPRWAIEVLRILRAHDPRYRLLLIGDNLDPNVSASAWQYHELLARDLGELEPRGAVRRTGRTNDVPTTLTDVGVIMSTSVRESFHCALVEGAASGAVPVVRDWPFFAGRGNGARGLFPPEWVVDTPQLAADRILGLTATESGWREAGAAASSHALATWDWAVTRRHYDQLLLGSDTSEDPATVIAER
jgi:glycosyltransferase involved in cell wall biosynthesis